MSVSRSVAEVLGEHVTLEVEGIDRMYLNVYVPALAAGGRGGQFLPLPPRATGLPPVRLMDPISQGVRGGDGAVRQARESPDRDVSRRANARTMWRPSYRKKFSGRGRRVVHRQGAGEDAGVPHRAAAQ